MTYQTELRYKNRGYMNLIVWQKAMDLFEIAWRIAFKEAKIDLKLRSQLGQKRDDGDWIARIAEEPEEYITTPPLQTPTTPGLRIHA